MLHYMLLVLSLLVSFAQADPSCAGHGDLFQPYSGAGQCLKGSSSGYTLQIQVNQYDNGGTGGVGYMNITLNGPDGTIQCADQRFTVADIRLMSWTPVGRPLWVNTFDCHPENPWALVDVRLCGDADDQAMIIGLRPANSAEIISFQLGQVARVGGCPADVHLDTPPPYGPQVPGSAPNVIDCMKEKCPTVMSACTADGACAKGLDCAAKSKNVDNFMYCLSDQMSEASADTMGCVVTHRCMDVNDTGYDVRFRDQCVLSCETERRVKKFYAFYNSYGDTSEKMPGTSWAPARTFEELSPLFHAYRGREMQLIIDLIDKYGPDPSMEVGGDIEGINQQIAALNKKDWTGRAAADQALGIIGGMVPVPYFGLALSAMESIWGWILGDDPWGFKARAKGVLLSKKAAAQIELLHFMKLQKAYKNPELMQGKWVFRARSYARVPFYDPYGRNEVFLKWAVYKFPKYNSTDAKTMSPVIAYLDVNEQFEVLEFVPLIHECPADSWGCIPELWAKIRKHSSAGDISGWTPVSTKQRCLEPQSIHGDGRPLDEDPKKDGNCTWWYLSQLSPGNATGLQEVDTTASKASAVV
jgi:hypothetical protein